jgi:hypothetical protein
VLLDLSGGPESWFTFEPIDTMNAVWCPDARDIVFNGGAVIRWRTTGVASWLNLAVESSSPVTINRALGPRALDRRPLFNFPHVFSGLSAIFNVPGIRFKRPGIFCKEFKDRRDVFRDRLPEPDP